LRVTAVLSYLLLARAIAAGCGPIGILDLAQYWRFLLTEASYRKVPARPLAYARLWITTSDKWMAVVVLANDFDPYDMNGGLVAAVAGRDYVVLATDTRLSSRYDILERNHVRSQLWAAISPSSSSLSSIGRHGMVAPDGSLAVNVQRDLCGVAASSNHEPL
jgi:hypothetical protein